MEAEEAWKARFIGEAKGRGSEEVNPRRCVWSQCLIVIVMGWCGGVR